MGQWTILKALGNPAKLPAGGTWLLFILTNDTKATSVQSLTGFTRVRDDSGGIHINCFTGLLPGGTQVFSGELPWGFAWRIA